ncbi:hypothetical protein [Flagellimonas halotolerans]|uniref:Uncharacterized protein n=1 Tax=Flagellimonas halotolerans TaxID=3112164 RepID=A0ABU6IP66_9FLAO|nr:MULTISPECIES: hypothetical protein [unclassified Allomuricauda]MEC3965253.1 hypothetical protein [Muricauda sp. SYSU M86414]MEC4264902.1 hypothetical protein [Muricauda sp. SYSU M84420]
MAVKHIPTGEVHKGYKGGITDCGFDTRAKPEHWEESVEEITCDKKGCKTSYR